MGCSSRESMLQILQRQGNHVWACSGRDSGDTMWLTASVSTAYSGRDCEYGLQRRQGYHVWLAVAETVSAACSGRDSEYG